MGHLGIFKKILSIALFVCVGVFAVSGCYLLVTYLTREKTGAIDKILIQNENQTKEFELANTQMYPGDSKTFTLEIKSELVENVNYELSFINHNMSEDDKFFYISITNDEEELIMNNTLEQVFSDSIIIKRSLKTYGKENLYITFSLSSIITKENYDYAFSMLFKANGRMTN